MVIIALFFLSVPALSAVPDSAAIPYPLACPPALTSTFADYRPGHFHSGIDLKTWGRIGVPVISEADGWVFRVSVSTKGYGKALYIKTDSGEYRVYGHLSDFSQKVDSALLKEQYRNKSYAVQLYFTKNELRVKKGDTMALSGQTGVGYPHLHVEYRNSLNQPLNLLRRGFPAMKDTRPPVLKSIAVKPLGPGSTVNAGDSTMTFKLTQKGGKGPYSAAGKITVSGLIGLALQASDQADEADNRFGIYKAGLFLNDSLVFSCAYDSFDFEMSQKIHLDYDLVLLRSGQGEYQNLHLEPGNTLPFYGQFKERAGLISAQGPQKIRIVAYDAAGNKSEALLNLLFTEPKATVAKAPDTVGMTAFDSGAAATIASPDKKAVMVVATGSVFKKTFLRVVPFPDSLVKTKWKEIIQAGPAYTIEPRIIYYDKSVTVSIASEKKARTGLFTSMGDKGWQFLSSTYDEKVRAYTGRIKENIPFTLFTDTVPPIIAPVSPAARGDTARGDRVAFRLAEEGSGIDCDRNITAELDGQWTLSEYDFETGEVTVKIDGLKAGAHFILIRVKDNLENETSFDLPFIRL